MYTQNEREAIRSALKKIEMYVKEHYVPRLRKFENVSVRFGEYESYPGNYPNREQKYSFYVSYDGTITFGVGGLGLCFNPPEWNKSCDIYQHGWIYAVGLLEHWPTVKTKIERKLSEKAARQAYITMFEA